MKKLLGFTIALGASILAVGVFPSGSAFAHDDAPNTNAMTAAQQNTEQPMKDFVLHAKRHVVESVRTLDGNAVFRRNSRLPGDWNSGSVYLITLLETPAGTSVINHGKFIKTLYGADMSNVATVKSLIGKLKDSADMETAACEQYGPEGSRKWACAASYTLLAGKYYLVAGFDHQENDPAIVKATCPPGVPSPTVTAAQVHENQDKDTLQKFVKGTTAPFRLILQQVKNPQDLLNLSGQGGTQSLLNCVYQEGPWRSGSVYLFVMTNQGRVLFNANNQELTGSAFKDIFDEDGVDISKVIIDAAGADGKGDFVEYKWDDPTVDGDEVNETGKSPGRSPKVTYVEGLALPDVGGSLDGQIIIVGSGYYPKSGTGTDMTKTDMMKTSGGGCAVAGAGAGFGSSAFGLFLAAFSVCFVLCTRSRSGT